MPAFPDRDLRPVRMASGSALTYVQPETASQILCQVLDKEQWERLLDGKVGRRAVGAPEAGCQIATERGLVSILLRKSDDAFQGESTVGGRPSATEEDSDGHLTVTVALTDDALRASPQPNRLTRQILELTMIGEAPDAQPDVAKRVLDEIVPLLAKDGEPLPEIDDQGHVAYVSTPLTGGDQFVDLPRPVQALQLCTLMLEEPSVKVAPTEFDVFDTARCVISTEQGPVALEALNTHRGETFPDRIAGRPARIPLDPPVVTVRLRDDAQVELYVSAPNSRALAEKLVPLLIN